METECTCLDNPCPSPISLDSSLISLDTSPIMATVYSKLTPSPIMATDYSKLTPLPNYGHCLFKTQWLLLKG